MGKANRMRTVVCTVVIPNGQTTANSLDVPASMNGLVRAIYVDCPAITGTSYTFNLLGPASGQTLFTKATLAVNAKTNILSDASFAGGNAPLEIPVDGACGVQIVSQAAEASQRTLNVRLLIEEGF
jgi:hypothetical protein